MEAEREAVGQRIREARRRLGRNRNQMARDLGTSWQHVDRWERGVTLPGPTSLRRLASYLGVTVDWLLAANAAPPALERYLAGGAPEDLTDAELEWLESAPVDPTRVTEEIYAALLAQLRFARRAGAAEEAPPVTPEAPATPKKKRVSGIREKSARRRGVILREPEEPGTGTDD